VPLLTDSVIGVAGTERASYLTKNAMLWFMCRGRNPMRQASIPSVTQYTTMAGSSLPGPPSVPPATWIISQRKRPQCPKPQSHHKRDDHRNCGHDREQ
jgi:hypothetical protein